MTKDETLILAYNAFKRIHKGCGHVIEDHISMTTTALAEHVRKDCIEGMDAIIKVFKEKN